MKRFYLAILLFAFCSAEAELPPLLSRAVLFGNPTRSQPQLAPAGDQIAWLAPDRNGVVNVWISALDGTKERAVTNENHRPIDWYAWAADSKHILYLQDNAGDEINHLFSADLTNGNVRDLTPLRGVRAQNVLTDLQHPKFVLVALNLRDRHAFDMYRVDLETGALTLEATNPGDVLTWATDNDFVIRAATAFDGKSGNSIVRVRDGAGQPWRDLVVMPFEQALFSGQVVGGSLVAGFAPDGKSLIIQSALGVDKGRLVRVDLKDGKELEVLAQDPQCDVANSGLGDEPSVLQDPVTGTIQAAEFNYLTSHWVFLDPKMEADFKLIGRDVPGFLELVSRDRADRKWIVAQRRSEAPASYYRFDRGTK